MGILNFLSSKAFAAPAITSSQCPTGSYTEGILKGMPCDQPVTELKWVLFVVNNILNNYLLPLAGVIFLIMIGIGGIQYITSAGNTQRADAGKKTITFAIVGLILMILAKVIVGLVVTALGGSIQ